MSKTLQGYCTMTN